MVVNAPDNPALAIFTNGLLNIHPELAHGLPDDQELNATCLKVFEKWAGTLTSHNPEDVLSVGSDLYSGYGSTSNDAANQRLYVQLSMEQPQAVYLDDFVNSSLPYELALETIRLVNQTVYGPLEVWTPDLIRELYGYIEWHGAQTDEEFLEEFESMNEEPFNPDEHEALLPSQWCDRMATAGYLSVGFKSTLSRRKLDIFKGYDIRTDELVEAMKALRKLLKLPSIHSSQENPHDKVAAAFVFLWNGDNFLVDALDEVVNYRYESGESSEAQSLLEYDTDTTVQVVKDDILYIERQLQFRCAIGRLVNAMQPFCEEGNLVSEGQPSPAQ